MTFLYHQLLFRPLFNLLVFLYDVTGKDFGVAIVLLTVIVRLIFTPLSIKALRSQKELNRLQPKIKELQEMLSLKVERVFSEIVKGGKEKAEIIVSFLALLELAKQKLVELHQEKTFGEIRIRGV